MSQNMVFGVFAACLLLIALILALKPLSKKIGLGFLIVITSLVGYFSYGNWSAWQKYEKNVEKEAQVKVLLKTEQGTDAIIERLEEKVRASPDNPKGWYLLGRLYASKNAWDKALGAFEKARFLAPEDLAIQVNYAQTLWQKNHKKFNPMIIAIFEKILKKNANQPDALAMLAMAAYDEKNYDQAMQYWERLLTLLPPQSQEAAVIRQAIGKISKN